MVLRSIDRLARFGLASLESPFNGTTARVLIVRHVPVVPEHHRRRRFPGWLLAEHDAVVDTIGDVRVSGEGVRR